MDEGRHITFGTQACRILIEKHPEYEEARARGLRRVPRQRRRPRRVPEGRARASRLEKYQDHEGAPLPQPLPRDGHHRPTQTLIEQILDPDDRLRGRGRGRVDCVSPLHMTLGNPGRPPLPRPRICEIQPGMSGSQRPTADDVRRAVADEGIEFLFAQFVDMHAKPSAKLVPAQQLDGLLADGAGFAGFAAGDIGQTPDNPDLIAMPDVGSFTRLPWKPEIGWFACDATVEGEEWPYCPRTILRHQLERAARRGLRVQDRLRARVLPGPPDRGRRDRDRRPARHARAALLRHPRADPLVRLRRRRRAAT